MYIILPLTKKTASNSFAKPPEYVKTILDAVLVLLDEPTGWDNA